MSFPYLHDNMTCTETHIKTPYKNLMFSATCEAHGCGVAGPGRQAATAHPGHTPEQALAPARGHVEPAPESVAAPPSSSRERPIDAQVRYVHWVRRRLVVDVPTIV